MSEIVPTSHPTPLRVLPGGAQPAPDGLVESYRRLADIFHDVLAEQSLDQLLERIADTLAELVPYEALHIYEADEAKRELFPALARTEWAQEVLSERFPFGEGITGWAVEHREPVLSNKAHLDPRVQFIAGTPIEPEALIAIPLIARGSLKGTLNIYRLGDDAAFTNDEFELAKRFGDAAALALDNAHIRASLEHQAQTDSLTGLYNHRYFHERLRVELTRASTAHGIGVVMIDIDDFKKVNDVYGHAVGDHVLAELADHLRATVRTSDVVCRVGGEEFAVIVPGAEPVHTRALAARLAKRLEKVEFDLAGTIAVSVGIAHGPADAANPRELIACAEAAMMTAKARGKNQVVLFGETETERPDERESSREDVRSIAHLKMLQSLGGKLNRLNEVAGIGTAVANELRLLIDYHNCRVFVREGDWLRPIAFRGDLTSGEPGMETLACAVGDGITGRVALSGESLLLGDAARCKWAIPIEGTEPLEESMIAVPLHYGSRVTGVIVISKLGLDQFDEDDLRLMEVLAGHAAVALENARLYEAQRREAESAKALLEFGRELASAQGEDEIVRLVVELSARILGAERTTFWLGHASGPLHVVASHGYTGDAYERLIGQEIPETVVQLLREHSEPFVLGPEVYEETMGPADHRSGLFAVVPLELGSGRFGTISATIDSPDIAPRQLELLSGLGQQARLALNNAENFESLERTFFSTIEALANALEARDEYTSSHARWITENAVMVGRELGLTGEALKRLELSALFHDIGKIGIPNSILLKPGPLTEDERELIETHPAVGAKILAPIDQLQDVCGIVRACHERYDGAGYPDRIAGEEIPIESRIIFACDAFHAMTSDRPYRSRLPEEEALRRLREAAGTQFDPAVVETCLRVLVAEKP